MPSVFPNITEEVTLVTVSVCMYVYMHVYMLPYINASVLQDQAEVLARIEASGGSLRIPSFPPQPTQPLYQDMGNPLTDTFLDMLGLTHQWTVPSTAARGAVAVSNDSVNRTLPSSIVDDPNELSIDDFDDVSMVDSEGVCSSVSNNITSDVNNLVDANEIQISDDESGDEGVAKEDECIVFLPKDTHSTVLPAAPHKNHDVIDFDNYSDTQATPFQLPFAKK
jgi:hypothetical protein